MAGHLGREIRTLWDPTHDILPCWRVEDDPTFIALKPAAEHSNRISASRLYELAQLFSVPMSYYYEGMELGDSALSPDEMLTKRETLELVKTYYAISDPKVREKIRKLTQAAAKLGQSPVAGRRRAPPDQAIEFDRSKIDGRTKVGKAALAVLKKGGRKSKADLEALAAVGYPGAAAKLRAARKPQTKPKGTSKRKAR